MKNDETVGNVCRPCRACGSEKISSIEPALGEYGTRFCTSGVTTGPGVTIPELGEVASIVEPCTPVKNLEAINPGDGNGIKLGGSLSWNRRLIVSAHASEPPTRLLPCSADRVADATL